MDLYHLQNSEKRQCQKYKVVILRGDIVKDDSGSYAVFTEQGSSASQLTAAKVMDITSRLPGCSGQAAEGQGRGPHGMSATGGGGLARVLNLRVCQHPSCPVWHTQGGKDELTPWYRLVGVAVLPVSRKGRRTGLPARASVATWYGDDCPHLSWKCAQVTGKAGENCQHSGEKGGSSPWTRPSAPWCGDTLEAPASDQRSILGEDRPERRLRGRYRLGHLPVVLLRTETAQCTVRPT